MSNVCERETEHVEATLDRIYSSSGWKQLWINLEALCWENVSILKPGIIINTRVLQWSNELYFEQLNIKSALTLLSYGHR